MTPGTVPTSGEEYERRLQAARRRAGYELGDPSWADVILDAFVDPATSDGALRDLDALDGSTS